MDIVFLLGISLLWRITTWLASGCERLGETTRRLS